LWNGLYFVGGLLYVRMHLAAGGAQLDGRIWALPP
jgi:hypothetical protein